MMTTSLEISLTAVTEVYVLARNSTHFLSLDNIAIAQFLTAPRSYEPGPHRNASHSALCELVLVWDDLSQG